MAGRLPSSAFEYYTGLGPDRSYTRVARHYGVGKRCVTERARREQWQSRVKQIEERAREKTEEKLSEGIAEVNARQLRMTRLLQSRALATLKDCDGLGSAGEASRILATSLKFERELLGLDDAAEDEDDSATPEWYAQGDSALVGLVDAINSRLYLPASDRAAFEVPHWIDAIVGHAHYWGERGRQRDLAITRQIDEILEWLDELAAEKKIDGRRPIHGQLLQALRGDDERAAAMQTKLVALCDELARYREDEDIDDDDRHKWQITGFGDGRLTWQELFANDEPESPSDPFAWAARRVLSLATV